MTTILLRLFGVTSVLSLLPLTDAQAQNRKDALAAGFQAPPDAAKPLVIWQWMNNNVTKEGITSDLESYKRVGVGGVQQFVLGVTSQDLTDPTIEVLNPKWNELMRFAIAECARLGLSFGTHNSPGWSLSGSPDVKVEDSMQKLVWTSRDFTGPGPFVGQLAPPDVDPKWNYYRDIAVLAVPVSGDVPLDKVINLTEKLRSDGSLLWDAPPGQWTLFRFGHTTTGKINGTAPLSGQGLEVDKFSRAALERYWKTFPEKLIALAGKNAGKAFSRWEIDSYEAGPQDWTPQMEAEFRQRRGYDLLPWLLVIAGRSIQNSAQSERFREDWKQTISDLFVDNYYSYATELVHRVPGMQLVTEPYTGPFDTMEVGRTSDVLASEFWWGPTNWGWATIKPVASGVHTTGRRVVMAESFTGQPYYGWQADLHSLRVPGDRAFALGVNQLMLHASPHQPWPNQKPGMTMGYWGTQFGTGQTWWEHGAPQWLRYVTRSQYLLQQGLPVGDICWLSDMSSRTPDYAKAKSNGYEGDFIAARTLIQSMSVKNGRLVLPDGMSYQILVLPQMDAIEPALLRKIQNLVREGATVYGAKPRRASGLQNYPTSDTEIADIAQELWGNIDGKTVSQHIYGKGRMLWGMTLEDALAQKSIEPDVQFDSGVPLVWTHRHTDKAEIYFLSNQKDEAIAVTPSFRVTGRVPEIWHAETGVRERAPLWTTEKKRTSIPLQFDPGSSLFIVFRDASADIDHLVSVSHQGRKFLPAIKRTPQIQILKATYGIPDDPAKTRDVTAEIKALVAQKRFSFPVVELRNSGDPAPGATKTLAVELTRDNKSASEHGIDGDTLSLLSYAVTSPAQLRTNAVGKTYLETREPGIYLLKSATGTTRKLQVGAVPPPIELTGPWNLHFPLHGGAPEKVTLQKLISWSDHPDKGVKYFSGTASYTQSFTVPTKLLRPNHVITLDLGQVKNVAEVLVNGRSIGTLWNPPFRIDVTPALKTGLNQLEIRVTNLWPNRLIGDEQLPNDLDWGPVRQFEGKDVGRHLRTLPDWLVKGTPRTSGRQTFTTFQFFDAHSKLLESGLLGPVKLEISQQIPLR